MSAFLGNIMIAITPSISKTSTSAGADKDTDDVEAIAKGGRGNFSYTWNNLGTDATINNKNSSKTKFTGKSTLGKSTAFCKIYDIVTGNTVVTSTVDVDWTAITLTASTITGSTTYNGSSQPVTVLDGINGTYSGSTSASGINVGSYTTTITGTGAYTGSVTGTLTISAATLNLTAAVTSFTYNGASQTLSYSVTGTGVDTGYSVSGTTASTNAGSFTATLTKSSTNYILGTSSINWSIGKAALTITTNNASMTYGFSLPAFSYTPTGFKGSDTASVVTGTVTHSTTGSSSANVGTYAVTPVVSGLSATNYTFTPANGTLTINAATLNATGTTGTATFNGDSQTVTVISGINGTYSGSTTAAGTNAGTYSTSISGTGNYTGSVGGTLTIDPATISFEPADLTIQGTAEPKTYDGTTKSISYVVTGAARNNYSYTISGTSGINVGTYTATITSTTPNYVISPTLNSFTWNITTPLTASGKTGSATYNGSLQSFTITGINGTYSGSPTVSGTGVESYTTTIYGTGNYTGSVTGTLTINAATLTASSTSVYQTYNRSYQSFTIGGINGTYYGNPSVSGINVGSYSTRIYGTGNYSGYVDGTLNIRTDSGYVDIFYGGVYDPSYTTGFYVPVRTANAAFSVTHSISGPGAADAQHTSAGRSGPYDWAQEANPAGAYVRNTNPQTAGWVLTITARITDSNYSLMIAETTVTFVAYVAPPPSGGGGYGGGGGFIAE